MNNARNLLLAAVLLTTGAAQAGNATWGLNPPTADWNTATNWTPITVPGTEDVATFNTSNVTDITFSQESGVLEMLFNPGASSFTYTVSHSHIFTLNIVGVVNNSGVTQNFVSDVDANGDAGVINFAGNATTDTQTVFTTRPATVTGGDTGVVAFLDFASAGAGLFVNGGSASDGLSGGQTLFFFNSQGGNATLISQGAQAAGGLGGAVLFLNQSHAANATLIAQGGRGGWFRRRYPVLRIFHGRRGAS